MSPLASTTPLNKFPLNSLLALKLYSPTIPPNFPLPAPVTVAVPLWATVFDTTEEPTLTSPIIPPTLDLPVTLPWKKQLMISSAYLTCPIIPPTSDIPLISASLISIFLTITLDPLT